jgi:HK97 gp10 family phage protein
MKVRVRVERLRKIGEALRDLPKATSKNVLRRVLKKRAEPIATTARRLVPVEQGDLQESITVSTKLSKRQRAKRKKEGADTVEMYVGPGTHPQGHMQEFGTSNHPPQPFMRPAWDKHKDELLPGIAKDLWAEIEKAVSRLARKAAKGR